MVKMVLPNPTEVAIEEGSKIIYDRDSEVNNISRLRSLTLKSSSNSERSAVHNPVLLTCNLSLVIGIKFCCHNSYLHQFVYFYETQNKP